MAEPSVHQKVAASVSEETLKALELAFPLDQAIPTESMTDRQIWMRVGERRVVDFIRSCLYDTGDFSPPE